MSDSSFADAMAHWLNAVRQEIDAIDRQDLPALQQANDMKIASLAALKTAMPGAGDAARDLIADAFALTREAGRRVNLALAGVERRLGALTGAIGHNTAAVYGGNGRIARGYGKIDLHCA